MQEGMAWAHVRHRDKAVRIQVAALLRYGQRCGPRL